jgi:hypothetical protein
MPAVHEAVHEQNSVSSTQTCMRHVESKSSKGDQPLLIYLASFSSAQRAISLQFMPCACESSSCVCLGLSVPLVFAFILAYFIFHITHVGKWNIVLCADGCCRSWHGCAAGSGKSLPHTHCDANPARRQPPQTRWRPSRKLPKSQTTRPRSRCRQQH